MMKIKEIIYEKMRRVNQNQKGKISISGGPFSCREVFQVNVPVPIGNPLYPNPDQPPSRIPRERHTGKAEYLQCDIGAFRFHADFFQLLEFRGKGELDPVKGDTASPLTEKFSAHIF